MKLIFPGSFDPFTKGHERLVTRALAFSDHIVIAIGESSKAGLIPIPERLNLIRRLYEQNPRIEVLSFKGLLVDTAKQLGTHLILRGLRHAGDFHYEMPMATMNRVLYPQIETLFLSTEPEHMHISSSMIREILNQGGDIRPFVSKLIAEYYIHHV